MNTTPGQRSIIITGAGSGIGRSIARAFAQLGDAVHLVDISADSVNESAELLDGFEVHPHVGDVSNFDDMDRVAQVAAEKTGRIDVMIAAAGVYDGYAGIEDVTAELWNRIIGVNLTGTFNSHRAAVPYMKESGGRLISIGSIGGTRGAADGLSYAASKAGIDGMNRRLAVDVAEYGITSNVIAPGLVDTAIRETSLQHVGHLYPSQQRRRIPADVLSWLTPAGRSGQPSEIAALAVFLSGGDAGFITGQTIYVDGGWTAQ